MKPHLQEQKAQGAAAQPPHPAPGKRLPLQGSGPTDWYGQRVERQRLWVGGGSGQRKHRESPVEQIWPKEDLPTTASQNHGDCWCLGAGGWAAFLCWLLATRCPHLPSRSTEASQGPGPSAGALTGHWTSQRSCSQCHSPMPTWGASGPLKWWLVETGKGAETEHKPKGSRDGVGRRIKEERVEPAGQRAMESGTPPHTAGSPRSPKVKA